MPGFGPIAATPIAAESFVFAGTVWLASLTETVAASDATSFAGTVWLASLTETVAASDAAAAPLFSPVYASLAEEAVAFDGAETLALISAANAAALLVTFEQVSPHTDTGILGQPQVIYSGSVVRVIATFTDFLTGEIIIPDGLAGRYQTPLGNLVSIATVLNISSGRYAFDIPTTDGAGIYRYEFSCALPVAFVGNQTFRAAPRLL